MICINFYRSYVSKTINRLFYSVSSTKVVFCGTGHFLSGFLYTKEACSAVKDINIIQCDDKDLLKEIEDADVVIPLMTKISKSAIARAKKLKLIMQFGVGLEEVDIEAATLRRVWVSRIPSEICGNAASCAEHAIFLTLALLRDIGGLRNSIYSGKLGTPTGKTLLGSKALIYGYGGIGVELASRLKSFKMSVNAIKRTPTFNNTFDNIAELGTADDLKRLVTDADIIYMCCVQSSETFQIVDKKFLSYLKRGAILINVARGGLLKYDDVLDSLNTGHLGGLGIDVFHTEPFPIDDPLLQHPKVFATPHVAGVTEISYRNMAEAVATNIRRIRSNEKPFDVVNEFNYY